MTEPLKEEWSWRTMLAGGTSFLGLFLAALTTMLPVMPDSLGTTGLILAALGQAYNGWVARDDAVSSEGHVAQKDR